MKLIVTLNDGSTEEHDIPLRSDGSMSYDTKYELRDGGLSIWKYGDRTFYPRTSYIRFETKR